VVVAESSNVSVEELPVEIAGAHAAPGLGSGWPNGHHKPAPLPGIQSERDERHRRERERLVRALAAAKGNKAEAARALGLARSTLLSRLKKHGLN